MFVRFTYLKLVRPNQGTFTTATPITTSIVTRAAEIAPFGGAGTAAPSTVIFDRTAGFSYYSNKAYSAVHAQLTAATSDATPLNLI